MDGKNRPSTFVSTSPTKAVNVLHSGVWAEPTPPTTSPRVNGLYVRSSMFPNEHIPKKDMDILQNSTYALSIEFNVLLSPSAAKRDAAPRPQNAWVLFLKNYRARIKKEHPSLNVEVCSQMASKEWEAASSETKDLFRALARIARRRHDLTYPGYRYKLSPPNKRAKEFKIKDETATVKNKMRRVRTQRRKRPASPVSVNSDVILKRSNITVNDVPETPLTDNHESSFSEVRTSNEHSNDLPLEYRDPPVPIDGRANVSDAIDVIIDGGIIYPLTSTFQVNNTSIATNTHVSLLEAFPLNAADPCCVFPDWPLDQGYAIVTPVTQTGLMNTGFSQQDDTECIIRHFMQ